MQTEEELRMSEMTPEEIVAHLCRSSLPTVVVEGKADIAAFYRAIEDAIGVPNASFLECKGRKNLLKVYGERSKFADKKVCFVADQDTWIFTGIPAEFSSVLFSQGYSIENDFYVDADMEKLLTLPLEKANHRTMIQEVARWFACEVEKCRRGEEHLVRPPNLHQLVPLPGYTCCPQYLEGLAFAEPQESTRNEIMLDYKLKLQGKLLFRVLTRFFTGPSASVRMTTEALHHVSRCTYQSGSLVPGLLQKIREALQIPGDQLPLNLAA